MQPQQPIQPTMQNIDPTTGQPLNQAVPSAVNNATPMQSPQMAQPQQPVGPAQNILWYWPEGSRTIFGAKKGYVTFFQGWLVVSDLETNQEAYRVQLFPDIKLRVLFGVVSITFNNGQKISAFDKKHIFYFYNPKLYLLSYLFMFSGMSKAKRFAINCRVAAGII